MKAIDSVRGGCGRVVRWVRGWDGMCSGRVVRGNLNVLLLFRCLTGFFVYRQHNIPFRFLFVLEEKERAGREVTLVFFFRSFHYHLFI